jgi:hypothetical protein
MEQDPDVVVVKVKELGEKRKVQERSPLIAVFARTAGKKFPIRPGSHAIRSSARTAKSRWLPSAKLQSEWSQVSNRGRIIETCMHRNGSLAPCCRSVYVYADDTDN